MNEKNQQQSVLKEDPKAKAKIQYNPVYLPAKNQAKKNKHFSQPKIKLRTKIE